MFEVLRMEARLNNRRKIQQILRKLNIKAHLTFKGLFKTNIARKVLLHYLDEIEPYFALQAMKGRPCSTSVVGF